MTGREKRDLLAYFVFIAGVGFVGAGVYQLAGRAPFLILVGAVMMVSAIYGAST